MDAALLKCYDTCYSQNGLKYGSASSGPGLLGRDKALVPERALVGFFCLLRGLRCPHSSNLLSSSPLSKSHGSARQSAYSRFLLTLRLRLLLLTFIMDLPQHLASLETDEVHTYKQAVFSEAHR